MKQQFIDWFTRGNNGYPPALNADGDFEQEKTRHMWEAYQAGATEQHEQVRLLTEQCDAVVVEMVQLKSAIKAMSVTAEECELNGDELRYVVGTDEFEHLTGLLDETPATSSAIAAMRAEGVEMFAKHCDDSIGFVEPEDEELYTLMEEQVRDFARQLRESKGVNHE